MRRIGERLERAMRAANQDGRQQNEQADERNQREDQRPLIALELELDLGDRFDELDPPLTAAEAVLEKELPMRSVAGFQIALEAADVRFRERGEQNLAVAIAHSHEQFPRERSGLPQIIVPQ